MKTQIDKRWAPHIHVGISISSAMRDVLVALVPIYLVAVYLYGVKPLILLASCLVTAAVSEVLVRRLKGRRHTLEDFSAFVTAALVAISLSASTYWWAGALATFIGIALVKELGGGLGWNRLNPALVGRLSVTVLSWFFLEVAAPSVDAVSAATPLTLLQQGGAMPGYLSLFTAFRAGAMAESSFLAVMLGGLYLVYRGHINWRVPTTILSTVFLLTLISGQDPVYNLLTGGLVIGAFFMATDWTTSPVTKNGRILMGVGCGLLTAVIRLYGGMPEGVSYAILIMNGFTPLIDRYTMGRRFGAR
jgi:electron transport complex protein RnfD